MMPYLSFNSSANSSVIFISLNGIPFCSKKSLVNLQGKQPSFVYTSIIFITFLFTQTTVRQAVVLSRRVQDFVPSFCEFRCLLIPAILCEEQTFLLLLKTPAVY